MQKYLELPQGIKTYCLKSDVSYQFMLSLSVAYPGNFFGGGFQQIQLRTEDRENGDLGATAP
jgi:hypothetical protein